MLLNGRCEDLVGDPDREFWWNAALLQNARNLLVKLRTQQKRVFGYKTTDKSQNDRLKALWGMSRCSANANVLTRATGCCLTLFGAPSHVQDTWKKALGCHLISPS